MAKTEWSVQGSVAPFLKKAWDIVDDPENNDIISWGPSGSSFIVHDPETFSQDVLPRSFKHNNFSSFVRQLNTYGFRKSSSEKWEFKRENFVKWDRELLGQIQRRKTGVGLNDGMGDPVPGEMLHAGSGSPDKHVSGSHGSQEEEQQQQLQQAQQHGQRMLSTSQLEDMVKQQMMKDAEMQHAYHHLQLQQLLQMQYNQQQQLQQQDQTQLWTRQVQQHQEIQQMQEHQQREKQQLINIQDQQRLLILLRQVQDGKEPQHQEAPTEQVGAPFPANQTLTYEVAPFDNMEVPSEQPDDMNEDIRREDESGYRGGTNSSNGEEVQGETDQNVVNSSAQSSPEEGEEETGDVEETNNRVSKRNRQGMGRASLELSEQEKQDQTDVDAEEKALEAPKVDGPARPTVHRPQAQRVGATLQDLMSQMAGQMNRMQELSLEVQGLRAENQQLRGNLHKDTVAASTEGSGGGGGSGGGNGKASQASQDEGKKTGSIDSKKCNSGRSNTKMSEGNPGSAKEGAGRTGEGGQEFESRLAAHGEQLQWLHKLRHDDLELLAATQLQVNGLSDINSQLKQALHDISMNPKPGDSRGVGSGSCADSKEEEPNSGSGRSGEVLGQVLAKHTEQLNWLHKLHNDDVELQAVHKHRDEQASMRLRADLDATLDKQQQVHGQQMQWLHKLRNDDLQLQAVSRQTADKAILNMSRNFELRMTEHGKMSEIAAASTHEMEAQNILLELKLQQQTSINEMQRISNLHLEARVAELEKKLVTEASLSQDHPRTLQKVASKDLEERVVKAVAGMMAAAASGLGEPQAGDDKWDATRMARVMMEHMAISEGSRREVSSHEVSMSEVNRETPQGLKPVSCQTSSDPPTKTM